MRRTKQTLVAIRLRRGRARELGQVFLIFCVLGAIVGFFGVLQYAACQRDHPGRPFALCFKRIP